MRVLLDTHVLIWAALGTERLGLEARAMLADPQTSPMFSIASLWEIAIKNSLGRQDFSIDPQELRDGLLANGYEELAIRAEHIYTVRRLPLLHRDPFDRMLVAQAQVECIELVTADSQIAGYPVAARFI